MAVHAVIVLFRAKADEPFDHEWRHELPGVLRVLDPGRIAFWAVHGAIQHVFLAIPIAQKPAGAVELVDVHVNLLGGGGLDEENAALKKEIIL